MEEKIWKLIEKDIYGVGERIGNMLVDELRKMGNTSISAYIVEECEENFYNTKFIIAIV